MVIYDTQNIMQGACKTPIDGAIALYLDFLNIFTALLQLFGILEMMNNQLSPELFRVIDANLNRLKKRCRCFPDSEAAAKASSAWRLESAAVTPYIANGWSIRCQRINGLYLPPIKDRVASTGQLN